MRFCDNVMIFAIREQNLRQQRLWHDRMRLQSRGMMNEGADVAIAVRWMSGDMFRHDADCECKNLCNQQSGSNSGGNAFL